MDISARRHNAVADLRVEKLRPTSSSSTILKTDMHHPCAFSNCLLALELALALSRYWLAASVPLAPYSTPIPRPSLVGQKLNSLLVFVCWTMSAMIVRAGTVECDVDSPI